MNWNDISSAVAKYAPLAGQALSSPVGAAIGVGTIIANLFGVDAKPEKVFDYIKSNPEKAEERLKFEIGNNLELQRLIYDTLKEQNRHSEQVSEIELQNNESARQNSINVNASPVDNNIKMILVIGQFSVLAILIILFFLFKEEMNQSVTITLGSVMGVIMANIASMINYYWGTSFSSQKKDDVIAAKK